MIATDVAAFHYASPLIRRLIRHAAIIDIFAYAIAVTVAAII